MAVAYNGVVACAVDTEGRPRPLEIPLSAFREALGVVRRFFPPTPLLPAPQLSRRLGAQVWLKLETVTPIRAFKLRGALNKMAHLPDGVGVVTASTGNHGLAVAHAARRTGRPACVWVPAGANPRKVEAIRAEGARVVERGRDYSEAYEGAAAMAREQGLALVHAYDDPHVIAGQGTIALEVLAEGEFDAILCGVGGGGLVAGVAAAAAHSGSRTRVIGVQPEGADSLARSLQAGRIVALDAVRTIAEGLAAPQPGEWTLALARRYVHSVVRVSDDDLRAAVVELLVEERTVAEPSGVAGLAALLRHGAGSFGRRLCLVVSGANISDEGLREALQAACSRTAAQG